MILSTLTRMMIQKCDLYHNDIISPHQGVLIIQRSHKASSKKHIYMYPLRYLKQSDCCSLCFVYKTEEIVRNSILRFFFFSLLIVLTIWLSKMILKNELKWNTLELAIFKPEEIKIHANICVIISNPTRQDKTRKDSPCVIVQIFWNWHSFLLFMYSKHIT